MKKVFIGLLLMVMVFVFAGCGASSTTQTRQDVTATLGIGDTLAAKQPTPTDINYSLERYNLIRRTYWVNGQREKAIAYPSPIADVPLGYCILFADSGAVIGSFVVDGKVSSLNSFLTPDSEYYEYSGGEYSARNRWLPDVDGSYGENDTGIFFFTPDGKYIEWTGTYLYSDIPFTVENPVLTIGGAEW